MSATIYGPLTDTYIAYLDGAGQPRTQLVSQTVGGTPIQVPWTIIVDPDTGARTGASNPLPSAPPAIAPQFSTALESAHIFNAPSGIPGPCVLAAFQVNTVNQSGWLLLYDAIAAPVNGAVIPIKSWQLGENITLDWNGNPIRLLVGCVLVFSTTGPFLQTAIAQAAFSAEIRAASMTTSGLIDSSGNSLVDSSNNELSSS